MPGLPHYVLFVRMLKFSRGTVQQYTLGLDFFSFLSSHPVVCSLSQSNIYYALVHDDWRAVADRTLSLFSTPLSPLQSGFSRSRLSWSYPSSSAACLSSSSSASSSLCRRVDASSSLEPSRSLPVSSSPLTHSHNFYITWVNIIKMY